MITRADRLTEETWFRPVAELVCGEFGESLELTDLTGAAALPINTLNRRFRRFFGMPPMQWVWHFRAHLAAVVIANLPSASMTEVAAFCGFNSSAHFTRKFRSVHGHAPTALRRNARNKTTAALHIADLDTLSPELIRTALERACAVPQPGPVTAADLSAWPDGRPGSVTTG